MFPPKFDSMIPILCVIQNRYCTELSAVSVNILMESMADVQLAQVSRNWLKHGTTALVIPSHVMGSLCNQNHMPR